MSFFTRPAGCTLEKRSTQSKLWKPLDPYLQLILLTAKPAPNSQIGAQEYMVYPPHSPIFLSLDSFIPFYSSMAHSLHAVGASHVMGVISHILFSWCHIFRVIRLNWLLDSNWDLWNTWHNIKNLNLKTLHMCYLFISYL